MKFALQPPFAVESVQIHIARSFTAGEFVQKAESRKIGGDVFPGCFSGDVFRERGCGGFVCGGCFGGAARGFASFVRDGVFLEQSNGKSALCKGTGTENARESAADDRRVTGKVAAQRRMGYGGVKISDFVHTIKILPIPCWDLSCR
jgi:hypothetical protein